MTNELKDKRIDLQKNSAAKKSDPFSLSLLLLGSNMEATGENGTGRQYYLDTALNLINANKHVQIIKRFSPFKTEAWGGKTDSFFLNQLVLTETELAPEKFLFFIKEIESKSGRRARKRWQSREIDIDILFYNDLTISTPHLSIPHPGISREYMIKMWSGWLTLDLSTMREEFSRSYLPYPMLCEQIERWGNRINLCLES